MLLQVKLQFCNNNKFVAISDVILGQNLSLGQNFLVTVIFLFTDILLKLQQQILVCFASQVAIL